MNNKEGNLGKLSSQQPETPLQKIERFYDGKCPKCKHPSLAVAPRPSDENIGPGPLFAACTDPDCHWAETIEDYQGRTGEIIW